MNKKSIRPQRAGMDEVKNAKGHRNILIPRMGVDFPIEEKIAQASDIHDRWGALICEDKTIMHLLNDYRQAVNNSWETMRHVGIVRECTACAVEDGGSCCGKGIEDKFDVVLLLINLLMGRRLPKVRFFSDGCWFLGEKGCTIIARHVICVNYLCKRLYRNIALDQIQKVQWAMAQETDLSFLLEESIKGWLWALTDRHSPERIF